VGQLAWRTRNGQILTYTHRYQQYEEQNGKVENHTMAKDLLAGFAAAEADKLFETHGLE
jgi:hypothetical protein